ncbi:hypothetical protein NQ317_008908 [Molorchus minor]|uniref:Retrotransposon gag domain-containing protein n=1 Tax=Molorchus minor TaxID=1323400 RepID=A0ABQ9JSK0_9CUCU|nr:hypothetical protein NQ317_008908 [Molorchus minor]
MDDLVSSICTVDQALHLYDELIELFSRGGFELVKWATNCPELLKHIPEQCQSSSLVNFDVDFLKVLGLQWCPKSDLLCFALKLDKRNCSKRNVLSTLARCFDPLGFLSPVTLQAKLVIKNMWILKLDWDDTSYIVHLVETASVIISISEESLIFAKFLHLTIDNVVGVPCGKTCEFQLFNEKTDLLSKIPGATKDIHRGPSWGTNGAAENIDVFMSKSDSSLSIESLVENNRDIEAEEVIAIHGTTNWDEIKQALLLNFGDQRDENCLNQDLVNLKQKQNESPQQFYEKFPRGPINLQKHPNPPKQKFPTNSQVFNKNQNVWKPSGSNIPQNKPTPMSTSTRNTTSQFRRPYQNNFFQNNGQKPNFIVEELFNTEHIDNQQNSDIPDYPYDEQHVSPQTRTVTKIPVSQRQGDVIIPNQVIQNCEISESLSIAEDGYAFAEITNYTDNEITLSVTDPIKTLPFIENNFETQLFILILAQAQVMPQEVTITNLNKNPGILPYKLGSAKVMSNTHTFIHYFDLYPIKNEINIIKELYVNVTVAINKGLSINPYFPELSNFDRALQFQLILAEQKIDSLGPITRTKRGLVDGLGSLIKGITGNLDASDAAHYDQAIFDLQNNEKEITQKLNREISLTTEIIKNFNKTVTLIKNNQAVITSALNRIQSEVSRFIFNFTQYLEAKNTLDQIDSSIHIILQLLTDIENAITFARLGKMHPSIIKISELETIIETVLKYHSKDQLILSNTSNDIHQYYNLIGIDAYYSGTKIVFLAHFPIVYSEIFSHYHLYSVPTEIPQQSFLETLI